MKNSKVDEYAKIDAKIKEFQKKLKEIKEELVEKYFDENETISIRGNKFQISLIPTKKTPVIDPEDAFNYLEDLKKENEFLNVVKVQITHFKKLVGDAAIEKLSGKPEYTAKIKVEGE